MKREYGNYSNSIFILGFDFIDKGLFKFMYRPITSSAFILQLRPSDLRENWKPGTREIPLLFSNDRRGYSDIAL
jgi:hypothetical protein